MLNRISSGWTWLERSLNAMIDEINRQKPLSSASIAVEESPNGSLLKVTQVQQPGGSTAGQPGGGGGGEVWPPGVDWQPMIVIDNSTGQCIPKYIWYWGTVPAGSPIPKPAEPVSPS